LSPAAAFPWDEAMQLAFGRLGLSPRDFWAMTPREFAAAVRGAFGNSPDAPLGRSQLEGLMALYPDAR
jgi:uncharacterized phage protein (TIGR02216 family)